MWRALWILVILTVLAAGAAWLADRPGHVVLDWGAYRIETSAAMLAAGVALVAVAAALVYRVWLFFRRAPDSIRVAWRARRRNKGLQALTKGMVAVAAGDPDEARKQARRAENLLQDPPLTMLLSAQAAQLAGDDGAAERFFRAMTDNRETEFLGLRGLLNQAIKRGDRDAALILARRAYRLKPESEWVSASLFELQTQTGQWLDAQVTSREAIKHRHLPSPEGRRREAVLACQQALDAESRGDRTEAAKQAKQALDTDKELVPAAAVLARALLADGKGRKAAGVIERIWPRVPHGDLVALYARARGADDALARVKAIEKLAGFNPGHPESLIARATAALEADLWGEARTHLSKLTAGGSPSSKTCRLMARLEEAEHGDLVKAHDWLVAAATGDPDPAWICGNCGTAVGDWSAICGNCQSFDTLQWRSPPHPARPALDVQPLLDGETQPPQTFLPRGDGGDNDGVSGDDSASGRDLVQTGDSKPAIKA
ncbi:MAG: heme biosynthesis HemY N-terminal domain-containing protein [Rhodospirillales bacterium]